MAVTAPIIAAVIGAAGGIYAAKKMAPKPPDPVAAGVPLTPDLPVKPEEVKPQAVEAAAQQRQRSQRSKGRGSTILTGPSGLATGSSYEGKTLLGS